MNRDWELWIIVGCLATWTLALQIQVANFVKEYDQAKQIIELTHVGMTTAMTTILTQYEADAKKQRLMINQKLAQFVKTAKLQGGELIQALIDNGRAESPAVAVAWQ